jgi:hypothetical protein
MVTVAELIAWLDGTNYPNDLRVHVCQECVYAHRHANVRTDMLVRVQLTVVLPKFNRTSL